MLKNMPKLEVVLIIVVITAWTGILVPQAFAKRAEVERTGLMQCWDAIGNPIKCAGTGQDGEIQAGVAWPTPRFTDKHNGTVMDNLTGLIWLKNANCFGLKHWQESVDAANHLAHGQCDLTDGTKVRDWYLPNIKQLQSLIDYGHFSPALPPGHPFLNVQSTIYWSSTAAPSSPDNAWFVDFSAGGMGAVDKAFDDVLFMWPVRGGE